MTQRDLYEETDRISPHFAHTLEVWGDGEWRCMTCGPLTCPDCATITDDGERCGECLSYMAGFYLPEEGGQG